MRLMGIILVGYNGLAFYAADKRVIIVSESRKRTGGNTWMNRAWHHLLSLGFRLLYNEMAWSYDTVSWLVSRGQWRAWQRAAIPFLNGRRVLELAHGPGHMLLALEADGFQVTGLDLSPAMGRQASRRIKRAEASAALVRGQAQALPLAGATYDCVLSTFPTEFLADLATIEAIYRVLQPGGRLVIVPQARLTGGSSVSKFIEWLYAITGQRPQALANEHAGFWQVIQERFSSAGFLITLSVVRLESSEVTVVVAEKPAISALVDEPATEGRRS